MLTTNNISLDSCTRIIICFYSTNVAQLPEYRDKHQRIVRTCNFNDIRNVNDIEQTCCHLASRHILKHETRVCVDWHNL